HRPQHLSCRLSFDFWVDALLECRHWIDVAMPTTSGSRTSSQSKKTRAKKAPGLVPSQKRRFQVRLLKWYEKHGRDLPWRKTSDPYHILISEVMLQQTQVDRVIPKYHEFLGRY